MDNQDKIIYPELSYQLTGLFYKVHNKLGCHGREKQYSDLLEELLRLDGLKYEREKEIKTELINNFNTKNRIDFIVENKILIEVKAKRFVDREDYHQTQRYLRELNLKLGIIVNFHQKTLIPKRIINSSAKE